MTLFRRMGQDGWAEPIALESFIRRAVIILIGVEGTRLLLDLAWMTSSVWTFAWKLLVSTSAILGRILWPLVLLAWMVGVVSAEEQRCSDLGSNCVCSEPVNTATYASQSWSGGPCTGADGCYWNPADSTTKECSFEIANHPIATYDDFVGSNDATALSRLPTGHSVTHFAARELGHSGTWFNGADLTVNNIGTQFNARMAIRFYAYHSPDYNFRDDTPPCHSKFLQGVGSWHWENFVGPIHMYDFFGTNWGPPSIFPRDCCFGNPGAAYQMTKDDWKGHWFRVEAVVTNRAGGASPNGVRHILYMQDVSQGITKVNGGNEFVASDWREIDTGGPQTWDGWDFITSDPRQNPMLLNYYREIGLGQCFGFRGFSHLLVAGWDTDTGQRIGAAIEIEGGGGGPAAPLQTSVWKHSGFLSRRSRLLPIFMIFIVIIALAMFHVPSGRP